MKLDTSSIRYLSTTDWRILTSVEIGSKNHTYVPLPLISQIAFGSSSSSSSSSSNIGTVSRSISVLAKAGLVARDKKGTSGVGSTGGGKGGGKKRGQNGRRDTGSGRGTGGNDAYRLTYGGLDYLAMHALVKKGEVESVGDRIGVGKESDIYVVQGEESIDGDKNGDRRRCLKIHRLGRISFRTVKANRDYLRKRSSGSWMYMSRLAALKEYEFMKILHANNFPVPTPLAQSRHTVLMSLITPAIPLRSVSSISSPSKLFSTLMSLIVRLACHGLIHGDFNEFNIMIYEDTGEAILIDFPQMVSIDHPNAKEYFERDVECVRRFFERKFKFVVDKGDGGVPKWEVDVKRVARLDVEVEASGFSRKQAKELEKYQREMGALRDGHGEGGEEGKEMGERDDDDEDEDDEEEGDDDDDKEEEEDEVEDDGEVCDNDDIATSDTEVFKPRGLR